MIRSITLENIKSFGRAQTLNLGKITVLVGPNNSGKSAFMSIGDLFWALRNAPRSLDYLSDPNGSLVHRPLVRPNHIALGIRGDSGSYEVQLAIVSKRLLTSTEELLSASGEPAWTLQGGRTFGFRLPLGGVTDVGNESGLRPFAGLRALGAVAAGNLWDPVEPLVTSRLIKLSLNDLRADAGPTYAPSLTSSGVGIAQYVAHWRESFPEKSQQLDDFVSRCIPEIRHVLTTPTPLVVGTGTQPPAGTKRLLVQQKDGERFDAYQLSDGVLCFIALAMHAIDAGPGSILFVEEPETSIHPTRIHQVVELFRKTAEERGCQIVIATHSPQLLNEFRDEPESILVFRRSPEGTEVHSVSELPDLDDELHKLTPGDMLQSGFFEKEFQDLTKKATGGN